ncbi:hypothetical protein [Kineococcus arenarius]|uniref:hypothetical protein n=1 Tax=Kineococcus sp. SYSU DK021 TaxID=3383142 RepID=UPI003D7CE7A9
MLQSVAGLVEGDWRVVGTRGNRSRLVRAPIGWWLPHIGYGRGTKSYGELYGSSLSLTVPLEPLVQHEMSSYEVLWKRKPPVRLFDPCAPGAVEVVLWWVDELQYHQFDRRSTTEEVQWLEKAFAARDPDDRGHIDWLPLAGWRLIRGSGDPLEVLDEAVRIAAVRRFPEVKVVSLCQ